MQLFIWSPEWNVNKSWMNTWMWAQHSWISRPLGSKLLLIGIDNSTRRVSLSSKQQYLFLVVGLLKPQTNSQRLVSFFQMDNVWSANGWLGRSSTRLIGWSLMLVCSDSNTAVESAEKTSVCSKYGGDCDENILDLQDRVPDRWYLHRKV